MLNNAPINDKLLIAAGVTLTCTVIIGVWSVFQFEKLYIETKKFDDYWLPGIHNVNNLQRTLITLHGTLYRAADSSRGGKLHDGKTTSATDQELLASLLVLQ